MRVLSLILMMTFLSHSAFGAAEGRDYTLQKAEEEIATINAKLKMAYDCPCIVASLLEELHNIKDMIDLLKEKIKVFFNYYNGTKTANPLQNVDETLLIKTKFNKLQAKLKQALEEAQDEAEDEELKAIAEKKAQDQATEVTSTSSRSRLPTPSVNSVKIFLARLSPFHNTRVNPDA